MCLQQPTRRKLFVSFTALLREMVAGRVTDADLASGLFAFGCTREHVLAPGSNGEYVEDLASKCPGIHACLCAAVLAAEGEGRVIWRKLDEHLTYGKISDLLVRNGLPALAVTAAESRDGYSYPGVRRLASGVDVVF